MIKEADWKVMGVQRTKGEEKRSGEHKEIHKADPNEGEKRTL